MTETEQREEQVCARLDRAERLEEQMFNELEAAWALAQESEFGQNAFKQWVKRHPSAMFRAFGQKADVRWGE